MSQFNTDDLRTQLKAQREKIQEEIMRLEQASLKIDELIDVLEGGSIAEIFGEPTTLIEATRKVCAPMIDGITRQRVVKKVREYATYARASESSIASALASLAQDEHVVLVKKGEGRLPSVYTTRPSEIVCDLSEDEFDALQSEELTKGTGGWQSLVKKLREATDKKRVLRASPELRSRISSYLSSYGGGGWQDRLKFILGRCMPHLFEEK